MTDHQTPPHDSDLEQMVLGALLFAPQKVTDRVMAISKPEHFYVPLHREIFERCIEYVSEGKPIDVYSLTKEMEAEHGGDTYSQISEITVRADGNIERNCHLLVEYHLYRKMAEQAEKIHLQSIGRAADVFDLMDEATDAYDKLLEEVVGMRNTAKPIEKTAVEVLKEIDKARALDEEMGVPWGLHSMDNAVGNMQAGDLMVIAARPGMGKTGLMLSMARNQSKRGHKVGLLSLEMTEHQLVHRLMSMESGVFAYKFRQPKQLNALDMQAITARGTNLSGIFINDKPGLKITEAKQWIKQAVAKEGVGIVYVDYLQLMDGERGKSDNRDNEIGKISRALKGAAKDMQIPIVAFSQLNREVEKRSGKRPMLADLRESGNIEQDADLVAFIYRPEYYGELADENGNSTEGTAEIIVAKNRHGAQETVRLAFRKEVIEFADFVGGAVVHDDGTPF